MPEHTAGAQRVVLETDYQDIGKCQISEVRNRKGITGEKKTPFHCLSFALITKITSFRPM